jgi:hypothetical protein
MQTLPAPVVAQNRGMGASMAKPQAGGLPDDPMQTIPTGSARAGSHRTPGGGMSADPMQTIPMGSMASMADDPMQTLPAPVARTDDDPMRTLPAPVAAPAVAPVAQASVAIKIAAAGTRFVQGGYLPVDQMWYELDDGCGHRACYGMVADAEQQGQPFSIGETDSDIRRQFREPSYARAVEISQEQYQAMLAVAIDPENVGFDQQLTHHPKGGIAFVWKAMQAGGMNPEGYQGDL